jgi:hypothetical protein
MLAAFTIALNCPGSINLAKRTPASIAPAIVMKMAIPPPNAIVRLEYLSIAGFETKLVRKAKTLIRCVSIIEDTNEPDKRNAADSSIV